MQLQRELLQGPGSSLSPMKILNSSLSLNSMWSPPLLGHTNSFGPSWLSFLPALSVKARLRLDPTSLPSPSFTHFGIRGLSKIELHVFFPLKLKTSKQDHFMGSKHCLFLPANSPGRTREAPWQFARRPVRTSSHLCVHS